MMTNNRIESIDSLRVFVRVAEASSFSAAAATLEMPTSTVSGAVRRLEQQLGSILLHRNTRNVRLTDAGRRLLERSHAVFEALEAAEAAVAPEPGATRGRLVINAPVALSREFLPPLLHKFMQKYPEVQLVLRVQNRAVDLIAEGIDLAFHIGAPPAGPVRGMKVGEIRGGLTASADYVAERGVPTHPDQLHGHDLISVVFERSLSWVLQSRITGERVEVEHTPRFACGEIGVLFEIIRRGGGIGWLPQVMRNPHIGQGLVRVMPDWTLAFRLEVWLVYLDRRAHSPVLSAFIDFVQAEVAALTAALDAARAASARGAAAGAVSR
jgi:DNA-binding transcriptional LysR family regulator